MAETVGDQARGARYRARVKSLAVLVALVGCGHSGNRADPDAALADDGDAGAIDVATCTEGQTRACGTDVGACELGTEACTAGVWGPCSGGVGPAAVELCDGVLDETCDGTVDEGCTNDPFDAASCGGPPPTATDALAQLGALSRSPLATATIQVRTRTCNGAVCAPWSAASNWQTRFLTYSGGVTTRYMNLQADTRIVLYKSGAAPKLSVQHLTFTQGGYPDSMGMVFDIPPAVAMYPVLRAYNVSPMFPSDYQDLELTLNNGELALGTRCARFTATVFGATAPYTTGYAALYRW